MDVELLKTFIEVYRTRHFRKAAENLFITQSAVSARIRLLEEELGVELFRRMRNNIQLTPAGEKMLRYAESMITTWNHALLDVASRDDNSQHIAFGGLPSLWEIFVPDWLVGLRQDQPNMLITADCLSHPTLIRRLMDQVLDFVMLYEPPKLPPLETLLAFRFRLLLVTRQSGLSVDNLPASEYIQVDWGETFAASLAHELPQLPRPSMKVALAGSARKLLEDKSCCAYLAEPVIHPELQKKKLFQVSGAPAIEREVYAVFRQDNDRREVILGLVHGIAEQLHDRTSPATAT